MLGCLVDVLLGLAIVLYFDYPTSSVSFTGRHRILDSCAKSGIVPPNMICYHGYICTTLLLRLVAARVNVSYNSTGSVSLPPGRLFTRCDGFGFCEKDDHGVFFGETMAQHLFPHAIYIDPTGFGWLHPDSDPATQTPPVSLLQIGDIVAFSDEYKQRLSSAILATSIYKWTEELFLQEICEPGGGQYTRTLGYLVVERPFPDENMIFTQLAQEPLLAGIATGLRSEVDPSSLIPSPTSGCAHDECNQFIAVSLP